MMWWEIKFQLPGEFFHRAVLVHNEYVKTCLASLNHQGARHIRLGAAPSYDEMMARKRVAGVA